MTITHVYPIYFVYIFSNETHDFLEIGTTGDITGRMNELRLAGSIGHPEAGLYLVYHEGFEQVQDAIKREATIRKMSQRKKAALVTHRNPNWKAISLSESNRIIAGL